MRQKETYITSESESINLLISSSENDGEVMSTCACLEYFRALFLEVPPDFVGECDRGGMALAVHYPEHLGRRLPVRRRCCSARFPELGMREKSPGDDDHLRVLYHGVEDQAVQGIELQFLRSVPVNVRHALLQGDNWLGKHLNVAVHR